MVNGYGPSEGTIAATACREPRKAETLFDRPRACSTWVVDADDHNRLLPIGAVGELLIQGPLVGRGYLDYDAKTAAAFIEKPRWLMDYPQRHHQRLYKTGDLVRFEGDGSISYLGRSDTQVKIRGNRIELSEIESRITQHDVVQSISLFAPRVGPLEGRLTAVISFRPQSKVDSQTPTSVKLLSGPARHQAALHVQKIQDDLSRALPSYVMPGVWIPVETMPLNVAGKAARLVVSRWLEDEIDEGTCHTVLNDGLQNGVDEKTQQPRSAEEKLLHAAWSSVLNIAPESLSVKVPFQKVGGDSFTAIQIASRCRKMDLQVKMSNLLKGDSIAQLAATCSSSTSTLPSGPEENGLNGACELEFELSPIQRMYAQRAPLNGQHHFNQSVLLRVSKDVVNVDDQLRKALDIRCFVSAFTSRTRSSASQRTTSMSSPGPPIVLETRLKLETLWRSARPKLTQSRAQYFMRR